RRSAMLCAPAPCAPTNAESWRKDRQGGSSSTTRKKFRYMREAHDPFPLTPALSPWAPREDVAGVILEHSNDVGVFRRHIRRVQMTQSTGRRWRQVTRIIKQTRTCCSLSPEKRVRVRA